VKNAKIRLLIQVLLFFAPWFLRKQALKAFLGFQIGPGARIGFSVVGARVVQMDEGAVIGHLNIVTSLDVLRLGANSVIGNLNWISCASRGSFRDDAEFSDRSLLLGAHAAITNRHLFDCSSRVEIGAFTTIAGWRSQFLTHSIDLRESRQTLGPIAIGEYCFVGTASVVLKGAVLPDHSVLAAGAVLAKSFDLSWHLYGGVPAKPVQPIDKADAYFTRSEGWVH